MFQSVNEINEFNFEDCVITGFHLHKGTIVLQLESLIVMPRNSQNTNYTESYADTATLELLKGQITEYVKEGYKLYDANDKLLKEVPDEPLCLADFSEFVKKCTDAYLYEIEQIDNRIYLLYLEFPGEDEYDITGRTNYRLKIQADSAIISWERYLNRVQR